MTRAAVFAAVAALSLGGCGGSADEDITDRGGPDSLLGFQWRSAPTTINGIELVLSFSFSDDALTATSTCNGTLSATTEAPVRYRYAASVPMSGREDAESGGATCFVEVASGSFDFEIVDNQLVLGQGDEVIRFDPVGPVAGLYGEWMASASFGTLRWSMGNGRIVATADCDNGLTVTTEVAADFANILDIEQDAQNTTQDGGLECTVAIAASQSTYVFEGDDLLLTTGGQTIRFSKN